MCTVHSLVLCLRRGGETFSSLFSFNLFLLVFFRFLSLSKDVYLVSVVSSTVTRHCAVYSAIIAARQRRHLCGVVL